MPPSPAMRISPGRELSRTDSHKRGHSLESGILYRDKDEDLALFNEVQSKERDNFLLQSSDDFDDIFPTKLRGLSSFKLGISVPARGESSDLLNEEGDKNDYEWLMTPPETPLFSSLDDEQPPVNLATRGRPRSQPTSLSRSSTMEKGQRSGRASASPHRLSPSHQSVNSTLSSRSRPFSATNSSPPPILHNSPSRGLSPPPSKPKPSPRSSTPTPGRMSTGSAGGMASSRVRGTSPIKTSRGNSASPKVRAWQANIPGFSSEAPPNLRTSLADRPASYVRGSSPASRNGSSKTGRKSMSPTPSRTRSVASSYSHDRDPFSPHSKGSVASSGDDDVDSLQSIPISISDRSGPNSAGAFSNSKVSGFSRKPIKSLSNSAPKRSFDLALRQMDRKIPQNMFRPLLSSVPSSTFYGGNASANHRSLTSINSSFTTSSNASSDQGTSGAHDTEDHEDVTSHHVREQYLDVPDEMFVMDQSDALSEDADNHIMMEPTFIRHDETYSLPELSVPETLSQLETIAVKDDNVVILDRDIDYPNAVGNPDLLLCSKCGCMFPSAELVVKGDLQVCLDCEIVETNSVETGPLETVMEGKNITAEVLQVLENEPLQFPDRATPVSESLATTSTNDLGTDTVRHTSCEPDQNQDVSLIGEQDPISITMPVNNQTHCAEAGEQQLQNARISPNSKMDMRLGPNPKVDVQEGAGISLLLKRSSSGKRHIVQSRSFTASNMSYDDFSYATDSVNSMRTSFGLSSASVSSSVDLGPSRQIGVYMQRQLSGLKSDTDSHRYEMPTKHKRSSSSLSGASSHTFQVRSVTPSYHEDSLGQFSPDRDKDVGEAKLVEPHELYGMSEFAEAEIMCIDIDSNSIPTNPAEELGQFVKSNSGDSQMMSVLASEELASHEKDAASKDDCSNAVSSEKSPTQLQASDLGEDVANQCGDRADAAEVLNGSSLDAISEMDVENHDAVSADSQSDVDSTNTSSSLDELVEPASLDGSNNSVTATAGEIDISDPMHGATEESTAVFEDNGGAKARSLILDEATDTVLSRSSTDDEETFPVEPLRPTVPVLDTPVPERRDLRSRAKGKRNSKSQKAWQRKSETDTKSPPDISESNEKPTQRIVGTTPYKADSTKAPPKLESKCNCAIM